MAEPHDLHAHRRETGHRKRQAGERNRKRAERRGLSAGDVRLKADTTAIVACVAIGSGPPRDEERTDGGNHIERHRDELRALQTSDRHQQKIGQKTSERRPGGVDGVKQAIRGRRPRDRFGRDAE